MEADVHMSEGGQALTFLMQSSAQSSQQRLFFINHTQYQLPPSISLQ